ncbi:MAG TPA: hypothetical protein PK006_02960 [Saprospiraceae bacterium]|nr:hypothetical protein [Saprospiraceae bacterium]
MNSTTLLHILRIVILSLIQILVCKHIPLQSGAVQYMFLIIYPVGLILLPLQLPQFFNLLIAFACGAFVDLFYQSPGVHAGACLWMMFCRPLILKIFEPKSGYSTNQHPTGDSLGLFWFLQYAAVLMLIFFIAYFSLEIFTFVYFGEIVLKTILSFLVSMFFIFILQIVISPKQ